MTLAPKALQYGGLGSDALSLAWIIASTREPLRRASRPSRLGLILSAYVDTLRGYYTDSDGIWI